MAVEFYKRLFENPDFFLLSYSGKDLIFVEMNRDSYHRSIFCDARIISSTGSRVKASFSDVYNYFSSNSWSKPELNFIFHIAHCGSTLLSRALDLKHENLVYREPFALRELAVDFASATHPLDSDQIWKQKFELATGLLGRKYEAEQRIIIKANVPINFIIPQLMDINQNSKGIFLYHTLEHYLLSILKSQNHQNWIKSVTRLVGKSADAIVGINEQQRADLSVPQLAAYLWLAQMSIYNEMLNKYPGTCSLNAEEVFNNPQPTLTSAFTFIGQTVSDEKISEIVGGELFSHNSKMPTVKFDNSMRLNLRDGLRIHLASELVEARTWLEELDQNCSVPVRLPKPLLGDSPSLL